MAELSKRVENTVGKGEIARYEQFLLFPQCFQKACFPGVSKGVVLWDWVNIEKSGEQDNKTFLGMVDKYEFLSFEIQKVNPFPNDKF